MRVLLPILLAPVLAAQEAPKPDPVAAKVLERAEQLLQRHAKLSRKVDVLVADYVQRRFTELSHKPLVSGGTFLFVKKPGCVVFRAQKPRQSIVRLTASRYEVFRPKRKRLERFALDGPELSLSLFAAVGGDAERLLREFRVRACGEIDKSGTVQIQLEPRSKEVQKRLRELLITFRERDAKLRSVAYRDHSGDLVEIELNKLQINPKDPPSVEFDVPKGTRILDHKAKTTK